MAFKNLRSPATNTNESPAEQKLGQPPIVNNLAENEERGDTKLDGEQPIKWPDVPAADPQSKAPDHKPMRLKGD